MFGEVNYYVNKTAEILWDYSESFSDKEWLRYSRIEERLDQILSDLKKDGYKNIERLKDVRGLVMTELLVRAKKLFFAVVKASGANKEDYEYRRVAYKLPEEWRPFEGC